MLMRQGSNEGTSKEFTQDTMFVAWRKLQGFSARKGWVFGWNYAIARNLRIDGVSKRPVWLPFPAEFETMSAARSSTEQKHFLQERSEIASVLDQLPFEQLQILEFSFIEGLTQSEIAAKLSLPLGTVKSRMRGAFENLHFGTEREI
jgi:RNA polymerase sigma-70 factor (ECF subfamily)